MDFNETPRGGKPPRATSASIIRTVTGRDIAEGYTLEVYLTTEGNTIDGADANASGTPASTGSVLLEPKEGGTILSAPISFESAPSTGTEYTVSGVIGYNGEYSEEFSGLTAYVS